MKPQDITCLDSTSRLLFRIVCCLLLICTVCHSPTRAWNSFSGSTVQFKNCILKQYPESSHSTCLSHSHTVPAVARNCSSMARRISSSVTMEESRNSHGASLAIDYQRIQKEFRMAHCCLCPVRNIRTTDHTYAYDRDNSKDQFSHV